VCAADRSSTYSEVRPLAASLLAVVAGVIPQFVTASVAGQIDRTFPFSHEMLGFAVALFNLVGVVLSPLMGRLLPRIGVTAALRLSAAIAGAASLGIALVASSAWQLLLLLTIAGISNGVAGPTASALVRRAVAERRHGLAFGTQQAGAPSALLLAGLAVPLIAVPFGWRWSFVGIAVVAAVAGLAAPPASRAAPATLRKAPTPAPGGARPGVWLLVIVSAGASAVSVGVVSFLVVYATHAGMSESAAGLLLGGVSFAAIVGRIGFGLLVDRGRADPLSTALPLLLACTIAVSMLTIGTPTAIVAAALTMGGLGWTWNGVLTLAIVRDNEDAPVWAVGMLMSGVFVGSIVGPLLVGFLSSQLSFRRAWWVCTVLSLVPLVALALARRRSAARLDPTPPRTAAPLAKGSIGGRVCHVMASDTAVAGRLSPFPLGAISDRHRRLLTWFCRSRTVNVVHGDAPTPGERFPLTAASVTRHSTESRPTEGLCPRGHGQNGARRRGGVVMRAQVAIVGAGPAGLVLSHLLHQRGITSIVLEKRSREYVEQRIRAGVLEQGTVDVIRRLGLDDGLRRAGLRHEGVEWHVSGRAYRVPVSELTGGRAVTVYGQRELTKDLIRARLETEEPLVFGAEDVTVHDLEGERAQLRYRLDGEAHEVECDFVAGCDGFHGVCRESVPAGAISFSSYVFPFSWLGILATVPPSTDEVIYAHHPRGFALHSMRSPSVSRLYLQCDPGDDIAEWPDDRIWEELQARLAVVGDWVLNRGPIIDKAITPLRSAVAEPMQFGRLFLAGDAAHIVPPTGAKGLNLAVADVTVLAAGLASWYQSGRRAALDAYSSTCLKRVWRVQHFASWMTWMFHTWRGTGDFVHRLQALQLENVCTSSDAARAMAENYVGLPIAASAVSPIHHPNSRAHTRVTVTGRGGPAPSEAIVGAVLMEDSPEPPLNPVVDVAATRPSAAP
jgi:p-hydroxybenzoate 3-monooxygenase